MARRRGGGVGDGSTDAVQVTLSPETEAKLRRIFPDHPADEVASSLARLAFEEWVGWLSGSIRYTSLMDQSIERVVEIFARLMPEREPDVGFLYNRFSIPYGRARYIVQALVDRQLYDLNRRATEQLIGTLEDKLAQWRDMDEEERKLVTEMTVEVSRRAGRILTNIFEDLPAEKKHLSAFRAVPSPLPGTRIYKIDCRDLEPLLEAARARRA